MHICLTLPDIHTCIIEMAGLKESEKNANGEIDYRTAYALARTCRAFLEPALDVLWSRQCDLQFLVSCMPDGLWEIREIDKQKHLVTRSFLTLRVCGIHSSFCLAASHSVNCSQRLGAVFTVCSQNQVFVSFHDKLPSIRKRESYSALPRGVCDLELVQTTGSSSPKHQTPVLV